MSEGNDSASPGGPSVTLYRRAATVAEAAVTEYESRLRTLADEGMGFEPAVATWPGRIDLSNHEDAGLVALYRGVETWAEEAGVDLAPAFQTVRSIASTGGSDRRILRVPIAALVLRVPEGIVAVYPHRSDGTTRTVADGLAAIARARPWRGAAGGTVVEVPPPPQHATAGSLRNRL